MKKLFKTKVVAIILATTLLSNNNAYGWEFGANVLNGVKSFFTAETNPILKATPGIISKASQTLDGLNSNVKILQSTYNEIPNHIQLLNEIGETTIDMTSNEQTLAGAQKCIAEYQNSTNVVINFIKSLGKKNWFGRINEYPSSTNVVINFIKSLGKKNWLGRINEYPIHNDISANGLTSDGAEYLTNLTESQKLNLANFEECVSNVPGSENIINKPWFQKLIANKNIINRQSSAAMLEKIKYHVRGVLETVTPDNQYLKYALITALAIGSIETIYALLYGIIKKDLGRGVGNVTRFNWNVLRFLPYTMPKWMIQKIMLPILRKVFGGHNGIGGHITGAGAAANATGGNGGDPLANAEANPRQEQGQGQIININLHGGHNPDQINDIED